jgi:hypothetical protein
MLDAGCWMLEVYQKSKIKIVESRRVGMADFIDFLCYTTFCSIKSYVNFNHKSVSLSYLNFPEDFGIAAEQERRLGCIIGRLAPPRFCRNNTAPRFCRNDAAPGFCKNDRTLNFPEDCGVGAIVVGGIAVVETLRPENIPALFEFCTELYIDERIAFRRTFQGQLEDVPLLCLHARDTAGYTV